ncbi:unnamed protein product [Brugia timori]|uniref:Myosin motor domain-containing protein n=1 Tax=Brugia timori TaxID=42155 RepID=A0A3P7W7F4_9BILA|nr:unnamed protein product [Brugia timori]
MKASAKPFLKNYGTVQSIHVGIESNHSRLTTANKIVKDERKDADLHDELLDDYVDFQRLLKGLSSIDFDIQELNTIFDVIVAILHLGNIHFIENVEDTKGGCMIKPSSKVSFTASLENAASLFGLEDYELKNGLTTRVVQLAKGGVRGTFIRIPLKSHDASAARYALAKEKKRKKSRI